MTRWEKEGIVYKRTQNWMVLPHGDECIFVVNNLGSMRVKLDYENNTIELAKRTGEDDGYNKIAYFPIEEMEEIVGHMKNAMQKRQRRFKESLK